MLPKIEIAHAFMAMVSAALAQGLTEKIAPPGSVPAGCVQSSPGEFEITIVKLAGDFTKQKELAVENSAGCAGGGTLVAQLTDGVLVDDHNRTGYIASNFQLQFDNPPQSGALYTAGFSRCGNDSLALGGSATFWQCASGTFWNLYDRWWAEQCEPVDILVLPCGGSKQQGAETVVGSAGVATTVVITTVTTIPICQIGDGKCPLSLSSTPFHALPLPSHPTPSHVIVPDIGHTAPCTGASAPTTAAVSQAPDGQVEATATASRLPPSAPASAVPVPTAAPPVDSVAVRGEPRGAVGAVVAVVAAVSTPKYWCKHCSTYVRDTKLERTNHEATAKHQGAVKRSLRDLHRNADQKERDKERARREVERLNGVVSGTGASSSSSGATAATSLTGSRPGGGAYGAPPQQASQADRQKQLEQLADLGVNIPTELRGNMAMAGEWTVTTTRVVNSGSGTSDGPSAESRATGVKRERERTEEEKEQDEAIKGLFKRPRKWGIDSKTMPADEDAELEALLSGPLVKTKKEEDAETTPIKPEGVKTEYSTGEMPEDDGARSVKHEPLPVVVKTEPMEEQLGDDVGAPNESAPGGGTPAAEAPAVVFKKRKPKTTRQK
ncbi:hypothetical protein C8A05DRAFT_41864 [Staphylotrichum tortipilum]|uniref:U1-type domain-containing protein n=1 Tax=Staphylotrichum tortipilum TaxID=2831512 RepID=A0AAN6MRK7_9PEZI|nr:hypothetical protein C8A05DRAFT_41864 [Staphylotrichum longicolle]